MDAIHSALDAGADPRSLARQIVDYLRGLMLVQMGNDDQVEVTKDVPPQWLTMPGLFPRQDVLRMMKAFNTAAVDTRGGWQPSLGLELAVAEVLEVARRCSRRQTRRETGKSQSDQAASAGYRTGENSYSKYQNRRQTNRRVPSRNKSSEA